MFSRRHLHRLLRLFLSSIALCFCLSRVVMAQTVNPAQLVEQGVASYQAGDYRTAAKVWQDALKVYQTNPVNAANVALVQENLARVQQQLGQSDAAIESWERVIAYYNQTKDLKLLGRSLTEQAQVYSSLGQPRKVIELLCGQGKQEKPLWTIKGEEKPLIDLSVCLPETAVGLALAEKDEIGEAAALGSLGDAYRLRGDYKGAIVLLESRIDSQLDSKAETSAYQIAIRNSLGNAYSSLAQVSYRRAESARQRGNEEEDERYKTIGLKDDAKALTYFQDSLERAQNQKDWSGEVRSLISAIPAYYRLENVQNPKALPNELRSLISNRLAFYRTSEAAKQAHQQAVNRLPKLPASRDRVYAAIDLARLLQPVTIEKSLTRSDCLSPNLVGQAELLLKQAVDLAQQLQDRRAESFALGAWGHLEECRDHKEQAIRLTEQAKLAADESLKAKDSLYLWEWQTGRILAKQGENDKAIAAYKRAIATLESIRSDILSANRDLQFDFRDTIDPIYRELVALQLEQHQTLQTKANEPPPKDNFKEILGTIDSLQVAELQNYFGNDCVIVAGNTNALGANSAEAKGDPSAAIINTFILDDRVAILLTLPGGKTEVALHHISRQELIKQINEFRNGLESYENDLRGYDSKAAGDIYEWLIGPFANILKDSPTPIKTLVFVQDGILRSVPMAALHDGKQFLIQKYAIATTPSLSATNTQPFKRNALRALVLGLTKEVTIDGQEFLALPNVIKEIAAVQEKIPGSKPLQDEKFTRAGMEKELGQTVYPIIHLATHGTFGADPQETFIVTGDSQKLTLIDLDRLIRQATLNREPLELLALTACKTAVGDDRAALGLAGVAIQAGARSALASLWSIDDSATAQFATDFYTKLTDTSLNKAQALQLAQKALIEQASLADARLAHPAYWAPFVLVGNWQ